ncbi:MAG: DMT family transporter, partial [Clostridia bacterium]|nr:DMT family transporter [Clostridia bacterium]
YLGPFTFNGCRFVLGAIALTPLMIRDNQKNDTAFRKSDLLPGCVLGAVLFLASVLQQMGVGEAGAGKAGFLTALYVVLVPLLGILIGKKTQLTTWLALLLALPALYLLCVSPGESIALAASDALLLASALFWALHILCTDHFVRRVSALKLCVMQFASAAILNFAFAFATETITADRLLHALIPVAYCGILSTGVGYLLQTVGQSGCRPAFAALIMSLESVFCVIAGALMLGEKMTAWQYAGCGLMLLAVVLAQAGALYTPRKEKTTHV